MTAVAGSVFTAADYNTHIRDNLNATIAGLAVDPLEVGARWPVSAGQNRIAMRNLKRSEISAESPYRSSDWGDLATPGPVVTFMATSGSMMVGIGAIIVTFRALSAGMMSFAITEANPITTVDAKVFLAPDTNRSIGYQRGDTGAFLQEKLGAVFRVSGLVPEKFYWVIGKYRLESGTALSDTAGANFSQRDVNVWGL